VALHPDPSVSRRRGRSRLHALGRKDGQALLDKARALVQAQRDGTHNPRHVDTQREMMQNLAQARLHRHKGRRTKGLLKK
jgi:hypothetical protein